MTLEDMDRELEQYLATRAGAAAGDVPPVLADGTRAGEWTVTGFIGRGGSSEVYCASGPRGRAALKVLASGTASQKARFAHEAALLGKFEHPAFPRFFGGGEVAGRSFFAMELLEPTDLPSSDRGVAAYMLAVSDGVRRLHAEGLAHRDLKPQNIMLRPSDGRPVIIDLGLAKEFESAANPPSDDSLSVAGGRRVGVGTMRYAAPEQIAGGAATPAADVHSLGVLANECFGGKPPARWARIVQRATSSIPGQRYGDVAAFMRAIRRRWLPAYAAGAAIVAATAIAAAALLAGRPGKGRGHAQEAAPPARIHATPAPAAAAGTAMESIVAGMTEIPGAGFLISRTECTQAQWEGVTGANPSKFKGADRPVENVSFKDVQDFIRLLNEKPAEKRHGLVFRLPTLEEWMLAARSGTAKCGFGTKADGTAGTADEMGWHKANSGGKTHPVGQKTPNAYGLFDMSGNVFEFVGAPSSDSSKGYKAPKGYVARCGGAYNWDAHTVRLNGYLNHDFVHRTMKYCTTGFRLAAEKAPAAR